LCEKNWSHSTSATRSYSRLADEIVLNLENFKIICWKNFKFFSAFDKGTVLFWTLSGKHPEMGFVGV